MCAQIPVCPHISHLYPSCAVGPEGVLRRAAGAHPLTDWSDDDEEAYDDAFYLATHTVFAISAYRCGESFGVEKALGLGRDRH